MVRQSLPLLDWAILTVYLGAVLAIGIKVAGRQRSIRDYFLGDRSLPWWAVALSIIATETSAATFVGTPGLAYASSWHYLQMVLGFIAARFFIALFVLKIYYRAEVVTVYGYLEKRFGEGARVTAALLFLLGRVIGSGVRLYAACLALRVAAGWTDGGATLLTISALGLIALAYTLLGGIKAVVWTECVLGTTLLLGGLLAAALILGKIPGGLGACASLPEFAGKLQVIHASPLPGAGFFSQVEPFWISFFGGFFLSLATHGTDQDMVQRMLTCPDAGKGGRSLMASAVLILPLNVIFLSAGSLLFFYHRLVPEARPPGAVRPDEFFLLFIGREVPAGLAGLVLAGLVSAAVSSHTSVLNALASTAIADFYRPHIRPGASERHYLLASRIFTAAWGIILILVAAAFVGSGENILKIALGVLTYFYGALLGAFLLGIFTPRGSSRSAAAGMLLSVPAVLLLQLREFIERRELASDAIRGLIDSLPQAAVEAVRACVPLLAWPLWIIAGTAITLAVGLLGRPNPPSAEPA